jgi:iron(III) transport system ATP-binding protein
VDHFYGDQQTLRGVTLAAEPGEVLCLLGPSGSGKTTLLRIAAGIEPLGNGRLFLNDREIAGPNTHLPPEHRGIGLMFQDFALFPHLSILDNVRFGLTALSSSDSKREALAALERVGMVSTPRIFRMRCQAANSSGWRLPGRWRPGRRSPDGRAFLGP